MAITDPRDIPGLLVWYSAQAETAYANGAQMTGWTDLSGGGRNATAVGTTKPQWQATTGPSGGPSVRFPNDGYFTLPNVFSGAAAGEALLMLISDGGATAPGLYAFGQNVVGGGTHYPYSDGVVYDNFGVASGQRKSFTPSLAITSWRRYNLWAAASDWSARLDATTQMTSATCTVTWDPTPFLGAQKNGAGVANRFKGNMACVVLYSRKLTTTERADLDAWLASNPSGGVPGGSSSTSSISLAGALPAIQSALTLSSYTETATGNRANGRLRNGGFIDESETPVDPLPGNLVRAVKVDKAFAYPTPTLVDGRPT